MKPSERECNANNRTDDSIWQLSSNNIYANIVMATKRLKKHECFREILCASRASSWLTEGQLCRFAILALQKCKVLINLS